MTHRFPFRPAAWGFWRDYHRADFFKDLGAGVTVGLLALPLAIGFGIVSGVSPAQGLWTAIIAAYGYSGLALASMMAGVILVLIGGYYAWALSCASSRIR